MGFVCFLILKIQQCDSPVQKILLSKWLFYPAPILTFHTEAQEEEALYKKMQADWKTRLLKQNEKEDFIKQLKTAK